MFTNAKMRIDSGDDKIAPIEVGYRVATESGTMAERSDGDALQKKIMLANTVRPRLNQLLFYALAHANHEV